MKRFISICVLLLLLGSCGYVKPCYAQSVGYIDVNVIVPKDFDRSIMINLISKTGTNCLITADYFNGWRANNRIEAGHYQVDFVSIDGDLHGRYRAEYPEEIEIAAEQGTLFEITITENIKAAKQEKKEEKREKADKQKRETVDQKETSSFGRLSRIVKESLPSIFIILVILFIFCIIRARRKNNE